MRGERCAKTAPQPARYQVCKLGLKCCAAKQGGGCIAQRGARRRRGSGGAGRARPTRMASSDTNGSSAVAWGDGVDVGGGAEAGAAGARGGRLIVYTLHATLASPLPAPPSRHRVAQSTSLTPVPLGHYLRPSERHPPEEASEITAAQPDALRRGSRRVVMAPW